MAKDMEMAENAEEASNTNHAEMRVYELGFHLDPELPQEEVKKTYQALRDQVNTVGSVVAEGEPTKVPLAYTISKSETTGRRDFDSAYFCWIAYETDGQGHETVIAAARSESRIVRLIDLRTSKDAAKHAAEMHEIFAKAALEPVEEEVSDVELEVALKEAGV